MSTTLGKNIKAFRKNKGFTQEELADLLNITPQAVSKWESESGLPDVSMLIPLAQVLGVTTDALLGYDNISENEEITSRIKDNVARLSNNKDRAQRALEVCEYLSTETNLNPGNFEIIKDYVQQTANLSMYEDPVLEGYFQDQPDRIQKIYKDCIRKGAYLISHCSDRDLVDKTHYALAWIYIHLKDFDKAKAHINVLPSLSTGSIRENIDMELVFFEAGYDKAKGFDNMKVKIKENSRLLFLLTAAMINTISQNYGWYGDREEAYEVCDWCENILKAYIAKKEYIDIDKYLRVRRSVAFFRMVAAKRAGEGEFAEQLYTKFAEEIKAEDLTDEEKSRIMDMLHSDIAYYSRYTGDQEKKKDNGL